MWFMIEGGTYLVECFCQDEQRRKIVNIDLFHFNQDQCEQQRLWEASQKGSPVSQQRGRSERCWWWPCSAESLLVVSAVVQWKPELGSYLKVCLGGGKNSARHGG